MPREVVEVLRKRQMDILWITEVPQLRREQDDSFHYQKAAELGRYLLTADADFWDDRWHPLKDSPGVIILNTDSSSVAKYLPVILRRLLHQINHTVRPLYLGGLKMKLSTEGITLKWTDRTTRKVPRDTWA